MSGNKNVGQPNHKNQSGFRGGEGRGGGKPFQPHDRKVDNRQKGEVDGLPFLTMPKPGVDPLVGDSADIISWRERIERWARRECTNSDIADVFENGVYPTYENPVPDNVAWNAGGATREMERHRIRDEYNIASAKRENLEKSKVKLFATMIGQICADSCWMGRDRSRQRCFATNVPNYWNTWSSSHI